MQQSAKNYTLDVLAQMIDGMIKVKEFHGFRRLNNGLIEDCTGQVFTVDLEQKSEATGSGDEAGVISHVILKLKPVSVVGRF